MKVMVGEMKVDSEGAPYTDNRFTYEENKENLGYQDLDIEVDGWSITIEQRVESEKITFSGVGKIFKIIWLLIPMVGAVVMWYFYRDFF